MYCSNMYKFTAFEIEMISFRIHTFSKDLHHYFQLSAPFQEKLIPKQLKKSDNNKTSLKKKDHKLSQKTTYNPTVDEMWNGEVCYRTWKFPSASMEVRHKLHSPLKESV